MKKTYLSILAACSIYTSFAQTNPAITNWLINSDNSTGQHYEKGNSTPISDTSQANVQKVQYSSEYAYINCSNVPTYAIGPYLDGNPATATNQNYLFQIPLTPQANTGTLTESPLGGIGIFINGVLMYDYKDGNSYSISSEADDAQNGDGVWNRDAIVAEREGFDCAKGHPSPVFSDGGGGGPLFRTTAEEEITEGSYHHHQNPTAFSLDKVEISDVCDLYSSDGLYTLDENTHSPLIGYAFDGFPVYGSFGYANTDGTGGIKRIESGYKLRSITTRTHYADGTDVTDGPDISTNFPLGWYKEDYAYSDDNGDLDEHNGRFCVTPEYPNGTYAYFATIDESWNSAYPYLVGPEYYGVVISDNFTAGNGPSITISETVSEYIDINNITESTLEDVAISTYPNPASDVVFIQTGQLNQATLNVDLIDNNGKVIKTSTIAQGSTMTHFDTRAIYNGSYIIRVSDEQKTISTKINITH